MTMDGGRKGPQANGEETTKGLWASMLDSAASGKRLAEKQLLVLGGNADSQKAFLNALSQESSQNRRSRERGQSKKPALANRFALGYTYHDILDADHDDILARMSVYLLADPHPSFSRLLDPLFTAQKVPDTLVVILLNWSSPWSWLRQLSDWIRLLRSVLHRLDAKAHEAMDENMKDWLERRKGVVVQGASTANTDSNVNTTLGPGEWDEGLGIPISVVCQDAEKIEILEREHGWKDDEFDFILQYMRTVLLKHGGSLIYTASAAPGQLQTLIRSSLDIRSLLQKNPVKHNVVDRDKVCVPSNWDSWGKIRVLKEGFDAEAVSKAWSIDVEKPLAEYPHVHDGSADDVEPDASRRAGEDSAIAMYEAGVKDPNNYGEAALTFGSKEAEDAVDVECPDNQDFLAAQSQTLDKLRAQDDTDQKTRDSRRLAGTGAAATVSGPMTPRRGDADGSGGSTISEHIGPVQMNMGGIQVDADDMLRGARDKDSGKATPEPSAFASTPGEGRNDNEKLANFFAGLMSRATPNASPKPSQSTSPRG